MRSWLRHLMTLFVSQPDCPVCGRPMAPVLPPVTNSRRPVKDLTVTCCNHGCVFRGRPFRVTPTGLELMRLSPVAAEPAHTGARS